MAEDKIMTWADFAAERPGTLGSIWFNREPTFPDFLARMWESLHDGNWTPETLPSKPATLESLEAYVNFGRWLVDCDCGGLSSVVEPQQDFLCAVCERWHRVEFPMLRTVIERNLLAVPGSVYSESHGWVPAVRHQAQTRYWRP